MACLLSLTLFACNSVHYPADGKVYDTPSDYLNDRKAAQASLLARVQPLSAPMSGSATVILPTRREIEQQIKPDFDKFYSSICGRSILVTTASLTSPFCWGEAADLFDVFVQDEEMSYLAIAQEIRRRHIFSSVEIVHADDPTGIEPPAGGYLIWLEADATWEDKTLRPYLMHMVVAGGSRLVAIVDRERAQKLFEIYGIKDDKTGLRRAQIWYVEEFVRNHPPPL